MKTLLSLARASIFIAALGASLFVHAQAPGGDQKKPPEAGKDDRPRREPPPQAYEDCKGKKEGAVVQITTPREGKISATCTTSSKGLFARPEHPPHPPEGKTKNPPPKK